MRKTHGSSHIYLVKVQQYEGELGGGAGAVLHGSDQEDGEVLWSPLSPLQVCVCIWGKGKGKGKVGTLQTCFSSVTLTPQSLHIEYLVYQ